MPKEPVDVRTDIAHTARVYDSLLGGKTNYPPDREAAADIMRAFPGADSVARRQRAFMHRSARFVAAAGVRQFLDIGTGIPTEPNLHQVVQAVDPGARVLYVDNDPIVLAHAEALMTGAPEGRLHWLQADAREPEVILDAAQRESIIDLVEPVSLSVVGLLHFLPDDDAARILRTLLDAVPAGSHLTITQSTAAGGTAADYEGVVESYRRAGIFFVQRDPAQMATWYSDLDLVDPGITFIHRWRPDSELPDPASDQEVSVLGMVARKR